MNKKGRLMIWCDTCQKYLVMNDGQFMGSCPHCGMLFIKMRCTRCGHKWNLREAGVLSKTCPDPSCKSPYWSRERVLDRASGRLVPADARRKRR